MKENNLADEVKIYAFDQSVFLNFDNPLTGSVHVLNALGQEVYRSDITARQMKISLANQASGMYLVNVQTAGGVITKRIRVHALTY